MAEIKTAQRGMTILLLLSYLFGNGDRFFAALFSGDAGNWGLFLIALGAFAAEGFTRLPVEKIRDWCDRWIEERR